MRVACGYKATPRETWIPGYLNRLCSHSFLFLSQISPSQQWSYSLNSCVLVSDSALLPSFALCPLHTVYCKTGWHHCGLSHVPASLTMTESLLSCVLGLWSLCWSHHRDDLAGRYPDRAPTLLLNTTMRTCHRNTAAEVSSDCRCLWKWWLIFLQRKWIT